MAHVVKLVQGSNSLDLTSGDYSVQRPDIRFNLPPPRQLWHTPDYGSTKLIRSEPSDRSVTVTVKISAADADTVENDIVAIRRYAEEAIRYELDGDNNPVYLQLQQDTATNAVNHRIKMMDVDDSQAHYTQFRRTTAAFSVDLNMVLEEYGEYSSTITLQNDLTSSPHFIEDSNSDGLADGWNVQGTPTTVLATDKWLIGGNSQKFTTDTSTSEGIQCDVVSCSTGQSVVGYVWLLSSGDAVSIILEDDVGTIQSKNMTDNDGGGVSDKTIVGAGGNTWYRVVVSGTTDGAATTVRLRVSRLSGVATEATQCWVDAAYLQLGTTTAPDAWMSARNIDNRNDIQSTSAATENQLNYIDVWGVPGDAPAWIQTKFDWTTLSVAGQTVLIAGSVTDGQILAVDQIHWIESDEFTDDSATFSDQTGTSDNHFHQTSAGGNLKYLPSGDTSRAVFKGPKRAYALIRASSTSSNFSYTILGDEGTLLTTDTINVTTAATWELHDFGLINFGDKYPNDAPDTALPDDVYIYWSISAASGNSDFDAMLLMPANREFFIGIQGVAPSTNSNTYIRGKQRDFIDDDAGYRIEDKLGSLWTVAAGNLMTRFVYATLREDDGFTLTNAAAITLTITPRTRHLLGT